MSMKVTKEQFIGVTYDELLDENARLKAALDVVFEDAKEIAAQMCNARAENAKLRELVRDMWHEGMCECGSLGKCATCMYEYPTRMRELGVGE